jgi:hypothetical protein
MLALVSVFSTSSNSDRERSFAQHGTSSISQRRAASRLAMRPLSYRSPGNLHKLIVPRNASGLEARLLSSPSARRVRNLMSSTLIEVTDETLASLDSATIEQARLSDDMNLVLLKAGQIDTTGPAPWVNDSLRQTDSAASSLHLVQLAVRLLRTPGEFSKHPAHKSSPTFPTTAFSYG